MIDEWHCCCDNETVIGLAPNRDPHLVTRQGFWWHCSHCGEYFPIYNPPSKMVLA